MSCAAASQYWLGGSLACKTCLVLVQVLGLEENADETVIRRQFRRLAQQVHPDKTRCFGAESAFKLISKAASVVTPRASAGAAGANECGNMRRVWQAVLGILYYFLLGSQLLMQRALTIELLLLVPQ